MDRPLAGIFRGTVFTAALLLTASHGFSVEPVSKLVEQLASPNRETRREAALQLESAGPDGKEAVPALTKALDDPDKQVWSNAVTALANLGPAAEPAIPDLIKTLDSRAPRGGGERDRRQALMRSAFALSRIGPAAIPPLIEALAAPDTGLRTGAAKALAGMGAAARPAVPALISNFGHEDAEVRREVIEALGEIGVETKPVFDALSSDQTLVRETAARTLARLGSSASGTAPALMDLLKSERDPTVRAAVFSALPSVQADPKRALTLLLAAIDDENELVRRAGVTSLLLLRSAQSELISALTAMLGNANPTTSERAADVLGRIGAPARAALPALIQAVAKRQPPPAAFIDALVQFGPVSVPEILRTISAENPDAITREHWSVQALKTMGGMAEAPLSAALSDGSVAARLTAARALGEMGLQARPAARALLKACTDADPRVRASALGALVSAHVEVKTVLPRMDAALHDPSPIVRLTALQLVPFLGPDARPLGPSILAALKDSDAGIRRSAIENVGPSQADAIPILLENLGDAAMQPAILEALARIGSAAESVAPRLFEMLPTATKTQRLQILAAISKTGATTAPPALTQGLQDTDPEIRAAALGAYAQAEHDKTPRNAALIAALADADAKPRRAAMEALGALGTNAREATPQLITLLHRDGDRPSALEALKRMEVRSVPHLLDALSVNNSDVKIYACERLAAIGPEAREALPALKGLLEAQNDEVRRGARRAVARIEPK